MVKITINLPGEWILSKRGQGALPIERIQRYLADHYAVSADTATFQTISFLIGDDVNRSELVENIARMLGESYSTDASSVAKLMEVSVSEGIHAS